MLTLEEGDRGEGGLRLVGDEVHLAVAGDLVEDPVERDHLAVEMVHGAESEVAVAPHLGKGRGAVVDTLQERIDRGELGEGFGGVHGGE